MPVREISSDILTPEQRMRLEMEKAKVAAAQTPEQRYEAGVAKLPSPIRAIAPGTMGEAGFAVGALPATIAALIGAPETAGLSLAALPFIGAAAGGALEDPSHRVKGAAYETGKAGLMELGGAAIGKGIEWGARFAGKTGLLAESAARIGKQIPQLFSGYPSKQPLRTAEDLQDQLGGGKISEAAGQRLGAFRSELVKHFGEYKPGSPSKLVSASPGIPYHFTAAIPAQGQAFLMPDLDAEGNVVTRKMGVGEAIDHVRELFAGGRTSTGVQKATASAPRTLDTAVKARDALITQLNNLEPGLGDLYKGYSTDYALAKQLQKVFAGSQRTSAIKGDVRGVIDQPKILKQADKVAAKLEAIKPGSGTRLRQAIAPTGAEATAEQGPGIRLHAGESGLRSLFHPPVPFQPETRQMIPLPARALSDPRLRAFLGYLAGETSSEYLGGKQ